MPPGRRTVRLFPGTRVDGRGVRRVRRHYANGGRCVKRLAPAPRPRAPATWLVAPPPPANVDQVSWVTLALAVLGASAVAGTLCLGNVALSASRAARRASRSKHRWGRGDDDDRDDAFSPSKRGVRISSRAPPR